MSNLCQKKECLGNVT